MILFQRIFQKFNQLDLKRKIIVSTIILLLITALFIMTTFTFFARRIIKEKSLQFTIQQIDTATHNTERLLDSLSDVSNEISANSWINAYIRSSLPNRNYTVLERSANEVISNQYNANSSFEFIALINYQTSQILYTGTTWTIPDFQNRIFKKRSQSENWGRGVLTYTFSEDIFHPEKQSFLFFQPLYKRYTSKEEAGLLVLSISEETLRSIYSSASNDVLQTYMMNDQGFILSDIHPENIRDYSPMIEHISGISGYSESHDSLIIYNRIDDLNWYLIGEVPISYLLSDLHRMVPFLLVGFIASCLVCIFLAYIISNTIYRPLQRVVDKMTCVSQGDLSVRITQYSAGEDIQKLNDGFNHMLDRINSLLGQVKAEQSQVEKIRFNTLQSQIQPHFLYNTLDSIHWQALYNQDKEVANMVKVLASYYRICLSKGSDIIPLHQELKMIKEYMIIQNIRYDNLVESHIVVSEQYYDIPIPKMSLQPLIENAIYHGFRLQEDRKGCIHIHAWEDASHIVLSIRDDGVGMTQQQTEALNTSLAEFDDTRGYGIHNVHRRIEIYFGKGCGLHYRLHGGSGVTVDLRLPKNEGTVQTIYSNYPQEGKHV